MTWGAIAPLLELPNQAKGTAPFKKESLENISELICQLSAA